MRPLRAWLRRLGGSVSASRRERDLADELESHFQMHVDDNIRAGMTPAEARRQAVLKFGPVEGIKEAYRDRAGFPVLAYVAQDLRYAVRVLRKAPAFSVAAIVTIALAIGVNAAIFSIINAAALQPLPVPEGARLVSVSIQVDGGARRPVDGAPSMLSLAEYEAVRDQTRAFDGVLAYSPFKTVTLGGTDPRQALATLVSCNYFDVLRIRPDLGRGLAAADCAGAESNVAILSDALWRSLYAADPSVVGRSVTINRVPFTIAGVAPRGFTGMDAVPADVYVPLTAQRALDRERDLLGNPNMSWLMVTGRLRADASLASARGDLGVIAGRITAAQSPARVRLDAVPATLSSLPEARTIVLTIGAVLLVAVALVLLIACANIANLLLARSAARRREIAVRMAVGAGRARLIQQLLTESLLLAAIGGAIGLLAATWASRAGVAYLLGHLPPGMWPLAFDPRPDGRVIAYAALLTTLTGLAFGLAPALKSTRDIGRDFRDTAATDRPGSRRLQNTLVTIQVAVCMVLLLAAGLLARGLHRVQTIDPGIAMRGISVISYDLPGAGYTDDAALAFQREVVTRLGALPGVTRVAETSASPLNDQHQETRFTVGRDFERTMEFSLVSPGYFELLHIPIVRGRTFNDAEARNGLAAMVTESTARRLWPGEDPLSQALTLDQVARPIVGIVRDAQVSRLGFSDSSYVYLPASDDMKRRVQVLVAGEPSVPAADIRTAIRATDAALAVSVARLEDNLEHWRAPSRLVAAISSSLAALALILACTGVFGTVAYAVSRRVREIGIRVALGAAHEDVLRLMVRQALRPVLIGVAIGLVLGVAASQVLSSMLFGISPRDPLSFVGVTTALLGVAVLACYVPARRALKVEPTIALRVE